MTNSFRKTFSRLQQQRKVFLKENAEVNIKEFIQGALDCFSEDMKKYKNSEEMQESYVKMLSTITSLRALKEYIAQLKAKGQKNKNVILLADYLHSAVLLYEYSLAVPEYALAVDPASEMLAANLVSFGILPEQKEKDFANLLKTKLSQINPELGKEKSLENQIQQTVKEVCAKFSIEKKKDIKKACELIIRTFAERDLNAHYGKEQYYSSLPQLMGYALQQYRDFHPVIESHRQVDLAKLESILSGTKNPKELEQNIRAYLSSMKRTVFGSHLKTLCVRALDYYNNAQKNKQGEVVRVIRTKDYVSPHNPASETHVLAIHGLESSLKTWDIMAQKWLKKGWAVHTYDQAGHGLDTHRRGKSEPTLDPTLMHFDLYQKLERLAADPKVETLHIYAHSFGGALVTNSLNTINKLFEQVGKKVEVHLITPAAMKSSALGLLSKIGEDISKDANAVRKIGPSRQGAISLGSLLGRFIRFMSRSLDNLRHYMKKEDSVPIHVHEAGKDKKVDRIKLDKKADKHSFFRHEKAGHTLHQEEEYAEKIVNPPSSSTPKTGQ